METYTFLKGRQTINDVPLKSLTFQTEQTKWDEGSKYFFRDDVTWQIHGIVGMVHIKIIFNVRGKKLKWSQISIV